MTPRRPDGPLALGSLVLTAGLLAACAQGPGAASPERAGTSAATPDPATSTTSTTTATTARPPSPTTRHTTATAASPRRTAAPAQTPRPAAAATLEPVPRAGAEPTVRFPRNRAASGRGANAVVLPVPDAVWARMVGYSWTEGCPVGRSGLRYVEVNFWGFDGKRSRGALVVARSAAAATAAAFTRLYDLRFRIRQMRPMDSSWGRHPKGPGANDYAAMEADNTSAFNCRYVGGEEEEKSYSRHAYGLSIDVNTFENPYLAADGTVYPDGYWAHRRGPAPGVFSSSSSAAVRAFTAQGMRWGGLWVNPDYQHFDSP